jgi:beta-lactamase regulating signal transducer with metallopeptidase domain
MIAALAPIAHVLFVVLLDGLWEGALFALAVALVLRLTPRGNATTRYAVLVLALAAVLVVPILTAMLTLARPAPLVATTPTTAAPIIVPSAPRTVPAAHSAQRLAAPVIVTEPATVPRSRAFRRLSLPVPRLVAFLAVGAWLLGMLYVGLRLAISLAHLEGLKRNALPLPLDIRTRLTSWTDAVKGTHGVRLCRSGEVTIPIAVGLFDAMILVPNALLEKLPTEDIDRIILHELAHLRRNDDWLNAFERVVNAVLFFNPAVRWLVGRLDLEREVACDDWVVTQTSQPLPYAHCLVRVVESATWPYRAMAAPGVFVTRRSMSIRIERLLSAHRDVRSRIALGPASLAVASIAALGVFAAYVSPSIADEAAATPRPASRALAAASPLPARPARVAHAAAAPKAPSTPRSAADVFAAGIAQHVATTLGPSVASHVAPMVASHVAPSIASHAARVSAPIVAQVATQTIASALPNAHPVPVQVADQDYIANMSAAGYKNLSLDQLIQLRSVGVTPELIRSYAAVGLSHLSADQLVQLAALGVDADYVRSMRSIFGNVTVNDLAQLRGVGVTPDYVQGLKAAGLTSVTVGDVASIRAVGVTPEYIHDMRAHFGNVSLTTIRNARAVGVTREYADELRNAGFGSLSLDDLQRLRAQGVDADYIRTIRKEFGNVSPDEISAARAVGVSPEYVDELRAAGITGLSLPDLQRMRAVGVDPDYVRAMRAKFGNVSVAQLVNAKAVGVTPDYADELRAAGLGNVGFDDLQRLRAIGIDADFIHRVKAHGFANPSIEQLVRIKTSGLL